MTLTDFQKELCTTSRWDFTDLKALFVNCTLKPSPELSHTEGLMRISMAIMEANGVSVDLVRAADHDLAPGVWPDMREHGAATDDWPALYEQVQAADILVLGSPIWLGEKSSICTRVIERLYACSSLLNEGGQYAYYGKVGGCLITGNEDGIKHCSMNILKFRRLDSHWGKMREAAEAASPATSSSRPPRRRRPSRAGTRPPAAACTRGSRTGDRPCAPRFCRSS